MSKRRSSSHLTGSGAKMEIEDSYQNKIPKFFSVKHQIKQWLIRLFEIHQKHESTLIQGTVRCQWAVLSLIDSTDAFSKRVLSTSLVHGASISIQLCDGKSFVEMTNSVRQSLQSFYDSATTSSYWHILGEVSAIRSTINDRIHETHLFDGLAFALHDKFESCGSEPKLVIVTSINPKIAGYFSTAHLEPTSDSQTDV
ncbi:hypothetical protein HID58_034114 [Brassica napus]|uniref:Uncharacterized protein n=1 Tax=Brassica napus TaxID=3708 RepID=A0ABQ8C2E6_BRANA|nr:hypothetical protein HID58_034114 [Brassica napus]